MVAGFGQFKQYGPWTWCSDPHPPINVPKLQNWYPTFEAHLTWVLQNNCTEEYEFYITHSPIPEGLNRNIAAVVSYILGNYDQLGAADMSAATVLLGLLPTTLSLLGCSIEEIGILGLRRPVLALLVAAGSPAVWPYYPFNSRDPCEVIQQSPRDKHIGVSGENPHKLSKTDILVSTTEYALASAAIINLVLVSQQLGERTVISWYPNSKEIPIVWAFISTGIHVAGMVMIMLPTKTKGDSSQAASNHHVSSGPGHNMRDRVASEFKPSAFQRPVDTTFSAQSHLTVALSWCISIAIVLHIIFGTLSFSGLLFISSLDALGVAARYLASTLVCRFPLSYEMSGVRRHAVAHNEQAEAPISQ